MKTNLSANHWKDTSSKTQKRNVILLCSTSIELLFRLSSRKSLILYGFIHLTRNECKNTELKWRASELQPVRISVFSCRSEDVMKWLQIMKTKQNKVTVLHSHHFTHQKKQSEASEKASIYHCRVFLPDWILQNCHWKGHRYLFQSCKMYSPLGVHWFFIYITHGTQNHDFHSSGLPVSQSHA